MAETAATMLMGMSCSARSTPAPAARRFWAESAPDRPFQTGAASLARVQIAEMPMAPAPMNRTLVVQIAPAASAAEAAASG